VATNVSATDFQLSGIGALAGSFLLLLNSAFSITATHDYLISNRVRWMALNELMRSGVAPEKIAGGFEFNHWYKDSSPDIPKPQYFVGPRKKENYVLLKEYSVKRWLPWGSDIMVEQRLQ